ncbi:MAG TPA: RluA family pseudouridine synthase [Acidimicrobiia bacterium]|nr:RluA family pseudouridine synthase [Acidimicrobiia bacterium]
MKSRLEQVIPDRLAGERADKIVAELAGVSREKARRLFEQGVTVDGSPVDPNHRISGGSIEFARPVADIGTVAEDVPFDVRWEDEAVLVIDKPAGIVVHPGAGRKTGTLASGLLHRYPELEGIGQEGRWGIVHRLDQGTSGLLLVARTAGSFEFLTAEMAARRIHRSYLALVHGVPAMPTGTIDAPIGRDPVHPTRKKVVPDGRSARTHYRVKEEFGKTSLLEVDLETGRTHQIRVHLSTIGHPVVGDRSYTRRADPVRVKRIFLHAARIVFNHPVTGAEIIVESPLPADLVAALESIRRVFPPTVGTVES